MEDLSEIKGSIKEHGVHLMYIRSSVDEIKTGFKQVDKDVNSIKAVIAFLVVVIPIITVILV